MSGPDRRDGADKTISTGRANPNGGETISNIEEFGCSVVQIRGEGKERMVLHDRGYDTWGRPDLIAVGLPEQTALAELNNAVNESRGGSELSEGCHRDIIGEAMGTL